MFLASTVAQLYSHPLSSARRAPPDLDSRSRVVVPRNSRSADPLSPSTSIPPSSMCHGLRLLPAAFLVGPQATRPSPSSLSGTINPTSTTFSPRYVSAFAIFALFDSVITVPPPIHLVFSLYHPHHLFFLPFLLLPRCMLASSMLVRIAREAADTRQTAYEAVTLSAFLMLLMELVSLSTSEKNIHSALAEKDKRKLPSVHG